MLNAPLYQSFLKTIEALGPWPEQPCIGVAVSGGPDSLALLQLTHAWAKAKQGTAVALHVDHQLRATSSQEANQLKQFCNTHSIPCHILVWEHGDITTKIQQSAREARYSLLMQKCKTLGILHLLTGHHKDDHLETIYMRQERQSGARGLSGIHSVVWTSSVRILRPLLAYTKEELIAYVRDLPYIQDPSNTNPKFTRVRTRQILSSLPIKTLVRLADTSKIVQVNRINEENIAWQYLAAHACFHPFGFARLSFASCDAPPLAALAFILQYVSGKIYLPNIKNLERLRTNLLSQRNKAFTLHTCTIWHAKGSWYFTKEYRHPVHIKFNHLESFYWDHRFLVDLLRKKHLYLGLELGMLGRKGWQQICHRYMEESHIPWRILETLPTFWQKDQVIGVPHLGIYFSQEILPRLRFLPQYDMLKFELSEKE